MEIPNGWARVWIVVALVGMGLWVGLGVATSPLNAQNSEKIVVHLSHYTDDLHAVFMALKLAGGMQAQGAEVTLFLDLEGVHLADSGRPRSLRWGEGPPLAEVYHQFIRAGGQVLLCPHCAQAAGLTEAELTNGARIGTFEEVTGTLLAASKIMDY